MKFSEEYRDQKTVAALALRIAEANCGPMTIMEVCGTHTMSIARYGIKSILPSEIKLISGPGCPVCVTPKSYVDGALLLSAKDNLCVCSFGDMIRVPGSRSRLDIAKAKGADVRIVTSTLEALEFARKEKGRQFVFLGVGFETTAPTIAASIIMASREKISNYSVLCACKTVPPALFALLSGKVRIDGFLLPGHVTSVIGTLSYDKVLQDKNVCAAVAGFEPTDILSAILEIVLQKKTLSPRTANLYGRAVSKDGNPRMLATMNEVFTTCDIAWRGVGNIPKSGLCLRGEFSEFDAGKRFGITIADEDEKTACRCAEVLTGFISPPECPLFGISCTPQNPIGACMVSSEGSCAASWKYERASVGRGN